MGENIQGFRVFDHGGGYSLLFIRFWKSRSILWEQFGPVFLIMNQMIGMNDPNVLSPRSPQFTTNFVVHIRLTVHYDIGTDETLVEFVTGLFPHIKIMYKIARCKFCFDWALTSQFCFYRSALWCKCCCAVSWVSEIDCRRNSTYSVPEEHWGIVSSFTGGYTRSAGRRASRP